MSGSLKDGMKAGDLTFNLVDGGWVITAPGSKVDILAADIDGANGVVHVIGGVLLPAATTTLAPTYSDDLVKVASGVSTLSTLVKAVTAADLVGTLQSKGPFTVFAPNDKAFAAVTGLDAILKDKATLTKILMLHVVANTKVSSGELVDGMVVGDLSFHKDLGGWIIVAPGSTARILSTDVGASNGVAHVIDTVLLPDAVPSKPLNKNTKCDKDSCWFYYVNEKENRCGEVDAGPSMGDALFGGFGRFALNTLVLCQQPSIVWSTYFPMRVLALTRHV